MDLQNAIEQAIKKDFSHEFLSCKADVCVGIKDYTIKIVNLIDSTDTCGDDFESAEDFEFDSDDWHEDRESYIEQEEANQKEFFECAKSFVLDIVRAKVGNSEMQKYEINFD